MKEPHRKDLASHPGPESCAGGSNAAGEALTGENTGREIELRNHHSGVPTSWSEGEGYTQGDYDGEPPEDPAESKALRMCGHSLHGNREIRHLVNCFNCCDASGLPMVSLRDALWPEIKAGRLKWEDVEADTVHPNDRGHDYAAQFVVAAMDQALKELPADDRLPAIKPLPAPLISDLFECVTLYEVVAPKPVSNQAVLKPVSNQGWTLDLKANCWKSDMPGSVIEFEVEGAVILMMHFIIKGPMGMASVRVDDKAPVMRDGWFDQTWGGYCNTSELARGLGPGPHRVRLELLDKKAAGSTGKEFRLLGLGAAGK